MPAAPRSPRRRHAALPALGASALALSLVGLAACSESATPGPGPGSTPSTTSTTPAPPVPPSPPGTRPATPGTAPARPFPTGPSLAVPMPTDLVQQRREWWVGEQVAVTTNDAGDPFVFFTTLLDPSTDEVRVSFTRWNNRTGGWTAPAEVLHGAQIRPLDGLSLHAATDGVSGRIAVVWERQTQSGTSTGADLAWSDDGGANWEHHTIDRPASMPRVALHDGHVYVAFRDLVGIAVASTTEPGREDRWSITPVPQNGSRRPTATTPVLGFDANWRPTVTYQTVETDKPTRWLTLWRADPPPDTPNPVDLILAEGTDGTVRLDRSASGLDLTPWAEADLTVPGVRCGLGLRVRPADGAAADFCPFGPMANPLGPTRELGTYVAAGADPAAPRTELFLAVTAFSPEPARATEGDLAPGIWVWRGEPGPTWAPPPDTATTVGTVPG